MIKSKWIHNNKIFPCQATPCGCESCSNRQIRQHRFRRRHHAWSSATKKGFWICPREKNTQVFPKKHLIWYVYFSVHCLDFCFWTTSQSGILRVTAADKTKRVKVLTDEQKQAVLSLTDPQQIPIQERRRQYNAINRRITNTSNAKSFPPGLVEKWRDADGDSTKKLLPQSFKPGIPQLVETLCAGFLDLIKFRFTSPVLLEVRILEMLLGRPELPVNAHRDLVQRVKVLARSRPIRNSKLTVHVVFISINCFRIQSLEKNWL